MPVVDAGAILTPVALFQVDSDPFQFCSECRATPSEVDDCWRCDGSGTVEPYDPTSPRYVIRTYLSDAPSMEGLDYRVRATLKKLPPEVDL